MEACEAEYTVCSLHLQLCCYVYMISIQMFLTTSALEEGHQVLHLHKVGGLTRGRLKKQNNGQTDATEGS